MGKLAYTHIEQFEPFILSMREAGMTRQEIADELGLQKSKSGSGSRDTTIDRANCVWE